MKLHAVTAVAMTLAACLTVQSEARAGTPPASSCSSAPANTSGDATALVRAHNDFGFRLFARVFSGQSQDNVFLSPLSATIALQMVYDGARGSTEQAMAKTLGLEGLGQPAVRRSAAALLSSLQSADPDVQLALGTSVWARAGIVFNPDFLRDVRQDYAAKVTTLDFSSSSAPAVINAWVRCATHGKMNSMVKQIPRSTVMYLMNAVYFHGAWSTPFDPKQTTQGPFTLGDGSQKQVPLMRRSGKLSYYAGPDFEMAGLPYGNGRFDMVIILPRRGLPLLGFARRVTPASWNVWTSSLHEQSRGIVLPRFTLQNAFALNRALAGLGMGVAFGRSADFSGLCVEGPCNISQVRQKTYLSVDERGTTAAGVTSGGVSATLAVAPMVVDHPFFVAIRDTKTGAVLFFGAVNRP